MATVRELYAEDTLDTIVIDLLDRIEAARRPDLHSNRQVPRFDIALLGRNQGIARDARVGADQRVVVPAVGHLVGAVAEPEAGLSGGPGAFDDLVPHLAGLHGP